MHGANKAFWQYANRHWDDYFKDDILEVGSYNINGSIKDIISSKCQEYIGVDWRAGPNVDIVSLAHEMEFDRKFKAVVSASMLEHDPHYEKSIVNMCHYVQKDGILILTWGVAANPLHCEAEAPDGVFHPLPAGKVIHILHALHFSTPLVIYDANVHKLPDVSFKAASGGWGELSLIAFPHLSPIIHVDKLLPDDDV